MARPQYPGTYKIEITGPDPGCEWKGEVRAYNKEGAVLMAGAAAERAGVTVLPDSWIIIEKVE